MFKFEKMGALNCCSSRKNQKQDKNVLDLDRELRGELEEETQIQDDLQDILGGEKIGDIFKPNEIMDKYLQDNLEDASDHFDQVGYLTFDYFIKVYKTALIWNRITFAEKKKELIGKRREALK